MGAYMNFIARLLFLITLLLTCWPAYSTYQQHLTSSSTNKAYKIIESNINKSASALNITQPTITWSKNNNGAIAVIEYKNKKVKIPFSTEELDSAVQGHIPPKTKDRIDQMLIVLPGGGGPHHNRRFL